eukprot:293174_1
MLPENTKLIIKEPYIKIFQNQNPAIRIDNPFTNIILFHDTLKPIIINTNKESINTLSIHALKEIGNKYFKSKQYKAAVKCYSVALTKNDQDNKYQDLICKLLNNRALCYIQLKNFQKAAKDANKALSMNDSWLKAKYTLCNALIGNKRYKEALNYLKGANLNKHKAFKTLTKTINRKILETSKEFVYDKPKTMQLWEPEIDFVSDSIEVVWINKKKGRGFVAVKDIKKGQLLVRETCFAMGYPVKNWSNYPLKKKQTHFEQNLSLPCTLAVSNNYGFIDMVVTQDYPEKKNENGNVFQNCISVASYNLLSDLMKKFVNGTDVERYKVSLLHDGSNRKGIIPCMDLLKYDELSEDVKVEDIPMLSARKMMQIIEKNCFCCPVESLESQAPRGSGIFIVSSFFNHSSENNNCDNRSYPCKQIIFAVEDIKRGQELTISYYDDYKDRCPFNYNDR